MKLSLEFEAEVNGIRSYQILEQIEDIMFEAVGGVDLVLQPKINTVYIENIVINDKYRGKGYLRKVINLIVKEFNPKVIACLPLSTSVAKFEHLGFKKDVKVDEDQYYSLVV